MAAAHQCSMLGGLHLVLKMVVIKIVMIYQIPGDPHAHSIQEL